MIPSPSRFAASFRHFTILLLLPALAAATLALAKPEPIDIEPIDIEMSLKRVSEHVYYVQGMAGIATDNKGFISNAAAIVTDDGVILVDT
ncbi:MAG: hypothetical protein K9L82_01530, partial [Chromatiaceae bacterium]|nr:hypothetical protein [Chromatiaceae bacterium]